MTSDLSNTVVKPSWTSVEVAAESLQPLTAALLECITPAEVVSAVVERGIAVLGAQAGLVALVTRDGQELEIVRNSGYAPQMAEKMAEKWARFPIRASYPLSDVVRANAPLFLLNRAEWAAKYPLFEQEEEGLLDASVSLPLAARQRVFGAMHFSFAESRTFTDADRAFLDVLARQCALALERALLLQEVETARAEAEAARERQAFLAQASALLVDSLDYQKTLDAVARLAVPGLCDWAAVEMVPDDENGPLLSVAVAHADPAEVAWVVEARQRYPVRMSQTNQPVVHAIKTGETVFMPLLPEDVQIAAAQDAEQLRLIRKLDLRSFLCVPLTARGKTLGAVTFASTGASGRIFTPETVEVVEELARRAAVAVDNARLYAEAQNEIAERREAETRFRTLADSAPVLIWMSGTDAKCDWFNQVWLTFTGRTMAQEIGNGWAEGVHPDDFDKCLKIYLESFAARVPFTMEYRIKHHDGGYRWLLDSGVPLWANNGAFRGYIGSCVDINEQRTAATRHRRFVREMLSSVTEGRLRLCEDADDLPLHLPSVSAPLALTPTTLRVLRQSVTLAMDGLQFPKNRAQDLLTGVAEASMNAVRHGGGGTALVCADELTRQVQVWIQDTGGGIREEDLHRATLEKGWSGSGSLGHGFFLILRTCDHTHLLTGAQGTTVVLEQFAIPPQPAWLQSVVADAG